MSDLSDPKAEESPAVAKTLSVELAVAGLLFIFGAVVAYESFRLGAGWTSDGPGAGYFPFYVGLIICISSLGVMWQALKGEGWGKGGRDESAFVNKEEFSRVLQVLIPATVYVFAIHFLGIYIASAIYIALFMIYLGKYKPLKSVITGIVVCAFFFMMFEVWFKVPLFKGSLNLLGFLGY